MANGATIRFSDRVMESLSMGTGTGFLHAWAPGKTLWDLKKERALRLWRGIPRDIGTFRQQVDDLGARSRLLEVDETAMINEGEVLELWRMSYLPYRMAKTLVVVSTACATAWVRCSSSIHPLLKKKKIEDQLIFNEYNRPSEKPEDLHEYKPARNQLQKYSTVTITHIPARVSAGQVSIISKSSF